jgi:putative CocE/NonD family hydrolase
MSAKSEDIKLKMRYLLTLSCLLLANLFVIAQQPNNPPIKAGDDVYDVHESVLIKTRDGASLSATIVRRKGGVEPLPAVLFYTTYDQGARDSIFGKRAVDKGYVGVVAYARGIRTNLDDYMPYEHDGNDLYDVIDWISKQPWCDGKVGMYGGSYTGFAQWAAVKHLHPALKTIVPQVAVMPGYDTPMENNVCASALCLRWPNDRLTNKPLPQDLYARWYEAGSSYRSLDALAGAPNRIFQKWLQHPAYDEYWRSLTPTAEEFSRVNIPVLTTTGYYDAAQIGAVP